MTDVGSFQNILDLQWFANLITVFGFPLAVVGLFAVRTQMKNDRLAVSAGALGQLRASMMTRVERLQATNQRGDVAGWSDELQESFNDLEMACAIYLDGQMSGRSGELARKMVADFLEMIENDEDLRTELFKKIDAQDTFTNIRDFTAKFKGSRSRRDGSSIGNP